MIEVHQNDQNDIMSFADGEVEYNIYNALDKVIADVAEPCTNCNDNYYRKTNSRIVAVLVNAMIVMAVDLPKVN